MGLRNIRKSDELYFCEGWNNVIRWSYYLEYDEASGFFNGYLQTKNKLIGNIQLKLVNSDSNENIDNDNMWYSLSDFYVDPEFRNLGFESNLTNRIKEFSLFFKSGIVKKNKSSEKFQDRLETVLKVLEKDGFTRFDNKTVFYIETDGEREND